MLSGIKKCLYKVSHQGRIRDDQVLSMVTDLCMMESDELYERINWFFVFSFF